MVDQMSGKDRKDGRAKVFVNPCHAPGMPVQTWGTPSRGLGLQEGRTLWSHYHTIDGSVDQRTASSRACQLTTIPLELANAPGHTALLSKPG